MKTETKVIIGILALTALIIFGGILFVKKDLQRYPSRCIDAAHGVRSFTGKIPFNDQPHDQAFCYFRNWNLYRVLSDLPGRRPSGGREDHNDRQ